MSQSVVNVHEENSNVVDPWQSLMDRKYETWPSRIVTNRDGEKVEVAVSYPEFISSLTEDDARLVSLGNLNYQVQNGGFSQWLSNGYFECVDVVRDCLEGMDGPFAREALRILLDAEESIDTYEGAIDDLRKAINLPDFDALETVKDFIEDSLNEQMSLELRVLDDRWYEIDEGLEDEVRELIETA